MRSYELNISDSFNVTEEFILGLHRARTKPVTISFTRGQWYRHALHITASSYASWQSSRMRTKMSCGLKK